MDIVICSRDNNNIDVAHYFLEDKYSQPYEHRSRDILNLCRENMQIAKNLWNWWLVFVRSQTPGFARLLVFAVFCQCSWTLLRTKPQCLECGFRKKLLSNFVDICFLWLVKWPSSWTILRVRGSIYVLTKLNTSLENHTIE